MQAYVAFAVAFFFPALQSAFNNGLVNSKGRPKASASAQPASANRSAYLATKGSQNPRLVSKAGRNGIRKINNREWAVILQRLHTQHTHTHPAEITGHHIAPNFHLFSWRHIGFSTDSECKRRLYMMHNMCGINSDVRSRIMFQVCSRPGHVVMLSCSHKFPSKPAGTCVPWTIGVGFSSN